MKPLAIIATHPIQYQVPLYRFLSARGLPLRVIFLSRLGLEGLDPGFGRPVSWDIPMTEGFEFEFLKNLRRHDRLEHFWGLINPGLIAKLDPERFCGVLVHGFRPSSMAISMIVARARRLPILYRAESIPQETPMPPWKKLAGRFLKTWVDAFLTVGSRNDRFYEALGIPEERRFLMPYSVDNARFRNHSRSVSSTEARAELGVPAESVVVLFAGKLVPKKQPDRLMEAIGRLPSSTKSKIHLLIVGDGEMRTDLERRSDELLPDQTTFAGFLNQTVIGLAYAAADLLVLPSRTEPWGLVVNEAMNYNVPALVSDRVGCADDLIIEGETGMVFRHDDLGDLVTKLDSLLKDRARLKKMGRRAAQHVQTWDFERCEKGLREALAFVGAAER